MARLDLHVHTLIKFLKNEEEKKYPYGFAAIIGYKKITSYHNNVITVANKMMLDRDIGHSDLYTHQNDQSLISLLTHREGKKMLDFDIIEGNINNMGENTQSRLVFNNGELLMGVWRQHGQLCKKILNKFYDSYKKPTYKVTCNISELKSNIYINISELPKNIDKKTDIYYSCLKQNYKQEFDDILKPKMRIIIHDEKNIDEQNEMLKKLITSYENMHNIKYTEIINCT